MVHIPHPSTTPRGLPPSGGGSGRRDPVRIQLDITDALLSGDRSTYDLAVIDDAMDHHTAAESRK